jgi:hypothetical protein
MLSQICCPRKKFVVDSRFEPKGEGLIVRGSGDHKSNLYCRYCKKKLLIIFLNAPRCEIKRRERKKNWISLLLKLVLLKLWIVEKLYLLPLLKNALLGLSIPLALFIFVRIEIGFLIMFNLIEREMCPWAISKVFW